MNGITDPSARARSFIARETGLREQATLAQRVAAIEQALGLDASGNALLGRPLEWLVAQTVTAVPSAGTDQLGRIVFVRSDGEDDVLAICAQAETGELVWLPVTVLDDSGDEPLRQTNEDFATARSRDRAGGTSGGLASQPEGIDAAALSVWVSNSNSNTIKDFVPETVAANGNSVGSTGSGDTQFNRPRGVHINGLGNLLVADSGNNRIKTHSSVGAYVSKFGSAGSGNGQFNDPRDVTQDSNGDIWVADAGNHRIQRFSSAGVHEASFGSFGRGNGQFNTPSGIAVTSGGRLWVADTGNHRVQEFQLNGTFVKAVGSYGIAPGQFVSPLGIEADGDTVWVADTGNHRVQEFDASSGGWSLVRTIGGYGRAMGRFRSPAAVSYADGNIWVADTGNNRIQKLGRRYLEPTVITAKVTWDPPSISGFGAATTTVTVTGAREWDQVIASFTSLNDSTPITARVSAADTVSVTVINANANSVNLVSGELRVMVFKVV